MYDVSRESRNERPNYFLSPHYPINPRVLKFGLSWTSMIDKTSAAYGDTPQNKIA